MTKIALVATFLLLFAPYSFAQKKGTFEGQIMDSTCAHNGSHDAGYKLTGTHTPKDCTLACVNAGAKVVLYNSSTHATYELDDQDKAKNYAGEDVKINGTYDPSSHTIHIQKIQKQ